jgi:uridylate kinase
LKNIYNMQEKETIIISLGGAIVVPDVPNPEFIVLFKNIILYWAGKNKKFVIVVGGGKTCRRYNAALDKIISATHDELDWMGIYTTRLNAELIRLSFGGFAHGDIIIDPKMVKEVDSGIIIGAGYKPGFSTDMCAVLIAEQLNAKKIINISNIDYVYNSDPKENPNAVKFENVSWKDYRTYISAEWKPGLSTPFDPIASEKAEKEGMEVAFMSGHNLESLEDYLGGKHFKGTTIKS